MSTRREFLKKASYVAPVIVTLAARPAFAGFGSGGPGNSAAARDGNRNGNGNGNRNGNGNN